MSPPREDCWRGERQINPRASNGIRLGEGCRAPSGPRGTETSTGECLQLTGPGLAAVVRAENGRTSRQRVVKDNLDGRNLVI